MLFRSDNTERASVGIEYKLKELLYLRGGYYIAYDTNEYSGGFGVLINTGKESRAIVDYSMVSMSALALVHRLTFSVTY